MPAVFSSCRHPFNCLSNRCYANVARFCRYNSPATEFGSFLKASAGCTSFNDPTSKEGEPNVFSMESQQWTFISVFLVQDSKTPIQGAYISRCRFQEDSRDLTLRELKEAYPDARLSPMEDIQSWIEKSSELSARDGEGSAPIAAS